jgi:hypothetical protein
MSNTATQADRMVFFIAVLNRGSDLTRRRPSFGLSAHRLGEFPGGNSLECWQMPRDVQKNERLVAPLNFLGKAAKMSPVSASPPFPQSWGGPNSPESTLSVSVSNSQPKR